MDGEDIDERVHINLNPVFDDLEQRGSAEVVLGLIDSGLPWDDVEEEILHPEFMSGRFNLDMDFHDPVLVEIGFSDLHGTAVLSLMAADANNEFEGFDNWGMTGVNTVSDVWFYTQIPVIGQRAISWDIEAFKHLVRNHEPHIVNYSSSYSMVNLDQDERELWEIAFEDLEDEAFILPLFVCAAGNDDEPEGDEVVGYPARYAFQGTGDYQHPAYPFVISVSALDNDANQHYSYDEDVNHVCVVAPGYTPNVGDPPFTPRGLLIAYPDRNPLTYNSFPGVGWWELPEPYEFHYWYGSGTSFSAPLVAGAASLILSEAADNNEVDLGANGDWGEEWNPWRLRRILEKTALDLNDDTETPLWDEYDIGPPINYPEENFDDRMGYGAIDCFRAVINRDLHQFIFEGGEWYLISSPVDPVYQAVIRILEDITLINSESFSRLIVLEGWDFENQERVYYDLTTEVDEIGDWDHASAYYIKITNAVDEDSLLICGQRLSIDTPIQLYDNAQNNGWNWVAYYPDYEADADEALGSLTAEDDLYLAKDDMGYFYVPDVPFCNLVMKPGKGYQMQLVGDRDVELVYPDEDPDPAPQADKGNNQLSNNIEHFQFRQRTGGFTPVVINRVILNDRDCEAGDEIGVFFADTLCIGAGSYTDGLIGFAAWENDEYSEEIDGYLNLREISYRYWDRSSDEELGQVEVHSPEVDAATSPSVLFGELEFDTPVRKNEIPISFELGVIYPNPFNSRTTITYSIPEKQPVQLNLYDSQGRIISTLLSGNIDSGVYQYSLDASSLPAGTYIVKLTGDGAEFSQTIQLIR